MVFQLRSCPGSTMDPPKRHGDAHPHGVLSGHSSIRTHHTSDQERRGHTYGLLRTAYEHIRVPLHDICNIVSTHTAHTY